MQTTIPEGALVPKNYYMPEEQFEHLALSETSIYKSISLTKGQVHELVILNEDLGSVLTWDFDILRHEVLFTMFHTKVPIPFTSTPPTPTSSISSSTGQAGIPHLGHTPHVNPNEHKSVIEKTWKEGVEFTKIEYPLVCHDGESIQVILIPLHILYEM